MHGRDNRKPSREEARSFFESLRVLFRERNGKVVLVWPITRKDSAKMLSKVAWEVGRESVVDLDKKGLYEFNGIPKSSYIEVADTTTRNLNKGQSLESFGLTESTVAPLMQESDTISEFYSRLEKKSAEINDHYRDILEERTIPSIWILVAGDDSRELNLTVSNLTQGIEKKVDIDRLTSYLDNPDLDAAYLKEWKMRRDEVAFLMRRLDVRIFELAPNVSLSAIRAYGDDEITDSLNLSTAGPSVASSAISSSSFFRALVGKNQSNVSTLKSTRDSAANEYRRVQSLARKKDKELNKALSSSIQSALEEEETDFTVRTEKQAPDSNLEPDILVTSEDGVAVCIEATWRSTGEEVEGELESRQSTLTVGHVQKYMLEKVLEYVKDLGF
jgi:flagellar basal body rod protein FlgC